ncbi:hypothetical protein Vretimale_19533 [Volvox reticuliferus]|uniref:Uncharacterized protein n=1 Tax=Volvox reticuliferus TaxID=1737510 RepID=A0A8J4LZT1_9CHLO|nr:hypothetical protein Vretifemale_14339 [Volvox reticuliferus]GIM16970.1 hypothetical protein Vretimale_19533 [Volvox reticuliferus]
MALAISRTSIARYHGFHMNGSSLNRRNPVCVRADAEERIPVVGRAALIEKIAKDAYLTKPQATRAFDTLFKAVQEAVTSGKRVTVLGFGTFESRDRKEKAGRNPRTGESITIPAAKAPAFRASPTFKEKVNGKAAPPKAKPAAPTPAAPKSTAPVTAATSRPAAPASLPAAAAKKTPPSPPKFKK